MTDILPTYEDVVDAHRIVAEHIHRTPVMESRSLKDSLGVEVLFKCENLQRTGAFKVRGAFNALSRLNEQQKALGVVTYSSGNHAQAIALAARTLGVGATIVMPEDAPASKLAATRGYGAEVITYDRASAGNRESIGARLVRDRGAMLIPPFDHPHVIAGQGTAAKELIEDAGELDALFVPLGGGGLLSGTILATRALSPACKIYGVEPAAGNDVQQSFRSGSIVQIEVPDTIADGARTQQVGDLTFQIIKREADDILDASDTELVTAMNWFGSRMKLVVEPTGCLGLAGMLQIASQLDGKRVGVMISGGNVDLARLADYYTR